MGWCYCGQDSQGRDIGYGISATCDYPGCTEQIDRGLAYACGGMHGQDEGSCEKYFCSQHLTFVSGKPSHFYCLDCASELEKEHLKEKPAWMDKVKVLVCNEMAVLEEKFDPVEFEDYFDEGKTPKQAVSEWHGPENVER